MGSVFGLDILPDRREPYNACMMACFRNASMLMPAPFAATDAARALAAGDEKAMAMSLFWRLPRKCRRCGAWRARRR
jgi:hypothetical protein